MKTDTTNEVARLREALELIAAPTGFARELERELAISLENQCIAQAESESRRQSLAFALNEIKKAEAEVERLRSILKDHATFLRKNGFENQANLLDPTK